MEVNYDDEEQEHQHIVALRNIPCKLHDYVLHDDCHYTDDEKIYHLVWELLICEKMNEQLTAYCTEGWNDGSWEEDDLPPFSQWKDKEGSREWSARCAGIIAHEQWGSPSPCNLTTVRERIKILALNLGLMDKRNDSLIEYGKLVWGTHAGV